MSYEVKRDDTLVDYGKKREEMLSGEFPAIKKDERLELRAEIYQQCFNKIEQYENLRIELVQKLCKEIDNCNARIDMYNRILLEKD